MDRSGGLLAWRWWDPKPVATAHVDAQRAVGVALHLDWIATTGASDARLHLWSPQTLKPLGSLAFPTDERLGSLQLSADGSRLQIGLLLQESSWALPIVHGKPDTAAAQRRDRLGWPEGGQGELSWARAGDAVDLEVRDASGASRGRLRLEHNASFGVSRDLTAVFQGQKWSSNFDPHCRLQALPLDGGAARWTFDLDAYATGGLGPSGMVTSPDDRLVAFHLGHEIFVLRASDGAQLTDSSWKHLKDKSVQQLAFDPSGETLVSCGRDGMLRLWDVSGL